MHHQSNIFLPKKKLSSICHEHDSFLYIYSSKARSISTHMETKRDVELARVSCRLVARRMAHTPRGPFVPKVWGWEERTKKNVLFSLVFHTTQVELYIFSYLSHDSLCGTRHAHPSDRRAACLTRTCCLNRATAAVV